jgi:hypothetical protein
MEARESHAQSSVSNAWDGMFFTCPSVKTTLALSKWRNETPS